MNEKAAVPDTPPANVADPAGSGWLQGRWQLILAVTASLAVAVIVAVLVFEVMEFQHYRQSPSIWPSLAGAK